jgi:hypothetical protein
MKQVLRFDCILIRIKVGVPCFIEDTGQQGRQAQFLCWNSDKPT